MTVLRQVMHMTVAALILSPSIAMSSVIPVTEGPPQVHGAVASPNPAATVAQLSIGNTAIPITISTSGANGKVVSISATNPNAPPPLIMSATGNKDPFIQYTLMTMNTSNTTQFYDFVFGIPIAPLPFLANGTELSNLSVTLSSSDSNAPLITPTYDGIHASAGIQQALLSQNGGATFLVQDEFGPLGGTISSSGTTTYSFLRPGSNSLPNTPSYNYLELLVGFNLGAGDTASLAGTIQVANVVPEPSTLSMALTSFVALLAYGLRSRWRVGTVKMRLS